MTGNVFGKMGFGTQADLAQIARLVASPCTTRLGVGALDSGTEVCDG
jgi:hypothetical protein